MELSQLLSNSPKEKEHTKETGSTQGSRMTGDAHSGALHFEDVTGPLMDLETSINAFNIDNHSKEWESSTVLPSKEHRRPRKASFGDALHDLRSFPQKTMRSIIGLCGKENSTAIESDREHSDQPPSPNWLRRAASTSFGRSRRPSLLKTLTTHNKTSRTPPDSTSPGTGIGPSISPVTLVGGAAARAAAAAQNERIESKRMSVPRQDPRSVEPPVPTDSESGIGIEIRDRFDCMDMTLPVVRQGVFSNTTLERRFNIQLTACY